MADVRINVGAQLDTSDVTAAAEKMRVEMNRVGDSIAKTNNLKFSPVDKATLQDLDKVQKQLAAITRMSGDLRKRLRETGQDGATFGQIDWSRMYADPRVAERQMRLYYQNVTQGTSWQGAFAAIPAPQTPAPAPKPAPGGGSGGGGSGGGNNGGSGGGNGNGGNNGPQSPGRRIIGSALNSLGPAGGVANGALSAGLAGGIGAGIGSLFGGLAALGIGKLISGSMAQVRAVGDEAIGYDTLKRSLGDVNVGFNQLREGLREASRQISVTYQESERLGQEFARMSGQSGEGLAKTLAQEVRVAGGFARSFGADPGQSVAFFGRMRQFGITSTPEDSQRLALTIGEAIAKSGTFAKTAEVLQAIENYTTQQTRLGLTSANATGYAGMLSGMVASGIPGLDVGGASGLLGRVNSAISSGGNAGEAGQAYLMRVLGRNLGLDPIQSRVLMEQGAFGSASSAFGPQSGWGAFMRRNRMALPNTEGMDQSNLQIVMQDLLRRYRDPEMAAAAFSSLTGVNFSQAGAMFAVGPQQLGDIQKRFGLDLSNMSSTGISQLDQIASGGRGTLDSIARDLLPRLSADESKHLMDVGRSGNDEALRKELATLVGKYGQNQTEGSRTRDAVQSLERILQDYATKALPLMNDMRNGIVYLAGGNEHLTARQIHERVMDGERKDINDRANATIHKANQDLDEAIVKSRVDSLDAQSKLDVAQRDFISKAPTMTPEQRAQAQHNIDALRARAQGEAEREAKLKADAQARIDAANKQRSNELAQVGRTDDMPSPFTGQPDTPAGPSVAGDQSVMQTLAETDRQMGGIVPGWKPGDAAAIIQQESGFRAGARRKNPDGTVDEGIAQINSGTLATFAAQFRQQYGHAPDPYNARDGLLLQRMILRSYSGYARNRDDLVRSYNKGPGGMAAGGGYDYLAQVNRQRAHPVYATPVPDDYKGPAAGPGNSQPVNVNVNVSGTLHDKAGAPAATVHPTQTTVGVPNPYGGRG